MQEPLECNERWVIKILKTAGNLFWLFIAVLLMQSNSQVGGGLAPLMVVVWAIMTPVILAGEPDLTISEEGMTVKAFWKKYFLNWNDIISVRSDPLQTWVFVRKLTPINYIVGFGIFSLRPTFRLGFERHNYRRAVEIIRRKIEEKKRSRL